MIATGTAFAYDHAAEMDRHQRIARIRKLAHVMDSAVVIPGTGIRFGVDPVLGLAPVIGDAVAKVISAFIIYEAHRLGLPKRKLLRMGGNLLVDFAFGSVPLAGNVFDVFWRANNRNLKMILDHFDEAGRR
jgi:hypothetical protein